ncbi:hypothetical protein [Pedobacter agri]|uniref:hypothetical protein n=1 Tax=Pedobacter agri TaxID=454586 RepID=UPI002930D569|nr:hypothetical protein [Pedobacter agri]
MNELLEQKDIRFRYKSFLITENGLQIKEKTLFSSSEYLLAYEDIGVRTFKSNKGIYGLLFSSGILVILSILLYVLKNAGEDIEDSASLFYFGLSTILLMIFLITYKRNFYLIKHGNVAAIEFLQNNPSKNEVYSFIEDLKAARNNFLLNKYGKLNDRFTYEQNYRNIVWLANNDVIDNSEFNRLKNQLDEESQQQKIGFNFSQN